MRGSKQFPLIVVVLQPQFGKFAGIESEVWRHPGPFCPKDVLRVVCARVAIGVLTTQPGNPAEFEAPQYLGVKSPVPQVFGGKPHRWVRPRAKSLIQRLRLPCKEREPALGVWRLPFPVEVCAVDFGARFCRGIIWTESPRGTDDQ